MIAITSIEKPNWRDDVICIICIGIICIGLFIISTPSNYENSSNLESISISTSGGVLMNKTSIDFEIDSSDLLTLSLYSELDVTSDNPLISVEIQYNKDVIWKYARNIHFSTYAVFSNTGEGRQYYVGSYTNHSTGNVYFEDESTTFEANLTREKLNVYQYLLTENSSLTLQEIGFLATIQFTVVFDNMIGGRANERLISFLFSYSNSIEGTLNLETPSDGHSMDAQWDGIDMFKSELNIAQESFTGSAGVTHDYTVSAHWYMDTFRDTIFYTDFVQPFYNIALGAVFGLLSSMLVRYVRSKRRR